MTEKSPYSWQVAFSWGIAVGFVANGLVWAWLGRRPPTPWGDVMAAVSMLNSCWFVTAWWREREWEDRRANELRLLRIRASCLMSKEVQP